MNDKNDRYIGAIIVDVQNKFDLIIELVTPLAVLPARVNAMEKRLDRIDNHLEIIKRNLKQHVSLLDNHDARIVKLEHAVKPS